MFKKLGERNRDLGNRGVVLILIGIAGLSAIFSALMRGGLDNNWWADVSQGLVTEMAGAIATFWLINLIFEGRRQREQKSEAIAERKAALIRQMGSRINEEAIRAVEELRAQGWLEDGSLRGANLYGSNLQGADLHRANLQRVDLGRANLKNVGLSEANLQNASCSGAILTGANLWSANLQGIDLRDAELQKANLWYASLQGAYLFRTTLWHAKLIEANLQGVDLRGAKLYGADLSGTRFNENTILPDESNWTQGIDITKFTKPNEAMPF